MVKLIAHRGNIFGQNKEKENSPVYIINAINMGYDVEVDLWVYDGITYLGHDSGEYRVDLEFMTMPGLWVHCKNLEALNLMLKEKVNCFFHQEDKATLTSRGFIWLYPGSKEKNYNQSIIVMPEESDYTKEELLSAYAICTDKVDYYRHKLGL